MEIKEIFGIAFVFCLFFAGVVMLGQHNVGMAYILRQPNLVQMLKLLRLAKYGGMVSVFAVVAISAAVAPQVTFACVSLSIGLSAMLFSRRMLDGQGEQVLLRGMIPAVILSTTFFQTGSGALHLPFVMMVDAVIIALACQLIADDADKLKQKMQAVSAAT